MPLRITWDMFAVQLTGGKRGRFVGDAKRFQSPRASEMFQALKSDELLAAVITRTGRISILRRARPCLTVFDYHQLLRDAQTSGIMVDFYGITYEQLPWYHRSKRFLTGWELMGDLPK